MNDDGGNGYVTIDLGKGVQKVGAVLSSGRRALRGGASGILDKMGYIHRKDVTMKSSRTGKVVAAYYEGQQIWAANTYEDFCKAYIYHPWVYSSVYAIGSAAGSVPFRLYERSGEGEYAREVEIEQGEDYELFRRPNPYMTGYDFWEASFSFLMLTGNIFWELVWEGDRVVEMYPLMSHRVEIKPDPETGLVKGYVYWVDKSQGIPFEAHEIMHIKFFHPLNDYLGLSPMNPVSISLATDFYAMAFNANFFKMGAKVFGVLETEKALTDPEFTRLREQYEKVYKGPAKSHKTMILESGLKYHEVGLRPKDMEFGAMRTENRKEVLGATKVPETQVGFFVDKTTGLLQQRAFWEGTMEPLFEKICQNITVFRLARQDRRRFCAFDTSGVSALMDGQQMRAEIDEKLIKNGIRTQNEIRRRDHLAPVPWGNTWHRPANVRSVSDMQPPEPDPSEHQPNFEPGTDEGEQQRQIQEPQIEGAISGESEPAQQENLGRKVFFKCPQCGARMSAIPKPGLRCRDCGAVLIPEKEGEFA